jgi:hypothetical protein
MKFLTKKSFLPMFGINTKSYIFFDAKNQNIATVNITEGKGDLRKQILHSRKINH